MKGFRRSKSIEAIGASPLSPRSVVAMPFRFRRPKTAEAASIPAASHNKDGAAAVNGGGDDEEEVLCLICQESLQTCDWTHPIQCANCTFNCCSECLEHLLIVTNNNNNNNPSQKIFEEENNTIMVATVVHCPNCRSDLSPTMCDTLLLRTVDTCQSPSLLQQQQQPAGCNNINNRWTELKEAMSGNEQLAFEIAAAREREGQFWEQKERRFLDRQTTTAEQQQTPPRSTTTTTTAVSADEDDEEDYEDEVDEDDDEEEDEEVYRPIHKSTDALVHEEWGLEVDARTGVHESIKMPRDQQIMQQSSEQRRPDKTLLAGLDGAMSVPEQETVTRHLVSGDPAELALAAKLLSGTAEKIRGFQQQRKQSAFLPSTGTGAVENDDNSTADSSKETKQSNSPSAMESHLVLVLKLIEAGKVARRRTNMSNGNKSSPGGGGIQERKGNGPRSPYTKMASVKAAHHRMVDVELRAQLAFLKRHPLPARMPKYCEIVINFDDIAMSDANHIVKCLPFRFCNDTWDGTLLDAFARISVREPRPRLPSGKNYAPIPTQYSTFVDKYAVKHHRRQAGLNEGVRQMMGWCEGSGGGNGTMRLDTSHPRVLIAAVVADTHCYTTTVPQSSNSISSSTGMPWASVLHGSGVVPGDVLTQLNGVELRDVTVDDLIARICSLCYTSSSSSSSNTSSSSSMDNVHAGEGEDDRSVNSVAQRGSSSHGKTLHSVRLGLVLNADVAVAKALQMRAAAIQNMYFD